MFIEDVELANFGDGNTIYAEEIGINELIKLLEKKSKPAIDWFKTNDTIVNPDKFQATVLSCDKKENKYTFDINDSRITSEDSVLFLGVEIDNKLN